MDFLAILVVMIIVGILMMLRDAESSSIEIDMDSCPIKPSISTSTSSIKNTKPIEPQKRIIIKKPIIKKEFAKESTSSKDSIKKEPIGTKKEARTSSNSTEVQTEKTKESAADCKFQFNEETIEYFSKNILGDFKRFAV